SCTFNSSFPIDHAIKRAASCFEVSSPGDSSFMRAKISSPRASISACQDSVFCSWGSACLVIMHPRPPRRGQCQFSTSRDLPHNARGAFPTRKAGLEVILKAVGALPHGGGRVPSRIPAKAFRPGRQARFIQVFMRLQLFIPLLTVVALAPAAATATPALVIRGSDIISQPATKSPDEGRSALIVRGDTVVSSPRAFTADHPDTLRITSTNTASAATMTNLPVRLSTPVREVVRMVKGGVSSEVLTSYIENSGSTFNLGPESIIYLQKIGISGPIISSMLAHDKAMRDNARPTPANAGPGEPYPPYQYSEPPNAPPSPQPEAQPQQQEAPYPGAYYQPQVDEEGANPDMSSAGYFYSDLSPYGSWYNLPGYGACWQPNVAGFGSGWAPYCNSGRWCYSNCGWYWNSYYPWGWAPFHYGRWWNHPTFGWMWFPGSTWAPSWVNWRCSQNFCGWCPLSPFADPGFGAGAGFNSISSRGFQSANCLNNFTFVPLNRFGDRNVGRFRLTSTSASDAFDSTTPINNSFASGPDGVTVNRGLDPNTAFSASSTPIPRVTVQDPPTDGGFVPDRLFAAGGAVGGGFSVFRPRLQNTFQERQQFFAMNGIGNGFRGLLPTGQPSTAQSQRINGANPQGLLPTGQPSTLQSLTIN